jgi:hypothetical protein
MIASMHTYRYDYKQWVQLHVQVRSPTLYSSLFPCQGQSRLVHSMVAFLNSIVNALSLKHSATDTSVSHNGQMNMDPALHVQTNMQLATVGNPWQSSFKTTT